MPYAMFWIYDNLINIQYNIKRYGIKERETERGRGENEREFFHEKKKKK